MIKKDIKKLTELEFEELLLTVMVGIYVRTAVLDSQGRDWKKIDAQLTFFLRLAEELGFTKLVERYNKSRLPNDKLCKREETIIEEFSEEEFWSRLEVALGQRDFFSEITKEDHVEMKKHFWLPEKVHEYYEKYEKEFIEHGIERLRVVKMEEKQR